MAFVKGVMCVTWLQYAQVVEAMCADYDLVVTPRPRASTGPTPLPRGRSPREGHGRWRSPDRADTDNPGHGHPDSRGALRMASTRQAVTSRRTRLTMPNRAMTASTIARRTDPDPSRAAVAVPHDGYRRLRPPHRVSEPGWTQQHPLAAKGARKRGCDGDERCVSPRRWIQLLCTRPDARYGSAPG